MGLPLYCLLIPCESDSDPLLAQLLFDGLDNTLNTFQILDPERRIFTPTFYFYFSKLVKKEQITNPLAQLETVSERSTEQVTARCALLAIQLRNIGKKFHPQDAVQVNQFVQYFGAGTPPWIGEKTVSLGLARAVIAQFEGLVQRLESDLTDVKVTQLFAEEVRHSLPDLDHFRTLTDLAARQLITYDDLLSFNLRIPGTASTRMLAMCESHVLTPVNPFPLSMVGFDVALTGVICL